VTKVYAGHVGLEIILDTGQSLTGATSMKIQVLKPDGTEVEWIAAQYDSTKIYYVTAAGELDDAGNYIMQSYVEWGPTPRAPGECVTLKVYERYK
jgi:hypothetical protein